MPLQKREENSTSLAATADKGKPINDPATGGTVSPQSSLLMFIGITDDLAILA